MAAPLENFQSLLEARMLILHQIEPRLHADSNLPLTQVISELGTFRKLNGIPQLFYYAFNQTAIRAAIEYETLLDLHSQANILNRISDSSYAEYDRALRAIFVGTQPDNVDPILAVLTKKQYLTRKQALEQQLASTDPRVNKPLLIKNFFIQLKDDIKQFREDTPLMPEARFGLLLQHHIDEIYALNSPPPRSITLKPVQESKPAPEHLLKLPGSGNARDFDDIEVADTPDEQSESSSIIADATQPLLALPPISSKISEIPRNYGFKFFKLNFTFNIMSDLGAKLSQDYDALHAALREHKQNHVALKSQIHVAKRTADQFFSNWYTKLSEGFQSLIQSANDTIEAQLKQTNAPKTGPLDAMATAFTDAIQAAMAPSISSDEKPMVSSISISILPSFFSNKYTTITVGTEGENKPVAVVTNPPPPPAQSTARWLPAWFSAESHPKDDLFTLQKPADIPPPPTTDTTPVKKSGWFW